MTEAIKPAAVVSAGWKVFAFTVKLGRPYEAITYQHHLSPEQSAKGKDQ